VRTIRRLFAEGGVSKSELARRFSVGHTTIRYVLARTTWPHLEETANA
jgi:DNA invertase Pin-like site-specific DNA recombinase